MHPSTLMTVRVKPDVAIRLEKLAESMDRSKSYLAAEAIEEYLAIHEWQVCAIHEGMDAADRGEVIPFEDVKKQWERRVENSSH